MVSGDTYAVIFCSLLQLASSWADDSHEHVHIKLHLPEVVRKHTHMKMIYKHHFHPKKIKFHDPHVLDPLPFVDRPFHGPDLFKLGIKSHIIDIKKPKLKFPKLTEWDLEPNLQTFPPLGKLRHDLPAKFPVNIPDYDLSEGLGHFPKFSHIEEDDEEQLLAPEAEAAYPGDLSMFGSSFARANAVLPPPWSYSGGKNQHWSMPSEEWMDSSLKYRLRGQPTTDEKIMQAMEAFSAKSNFNSAVMDLPMERFEKTPKRFKLRGNMRLHGGKTRL